MEEINQAYEDYQTEYITRKNNILLGLNYIKNSEIPDAYKELIDETIIFLNEYK